MTTQPRIPLDDLTSDALDALYDELDRLAAEVTRLTAGQCTHALATCEQHHTTPVAGCPYPRCRAATATGRAPTA
ncbi:hypothetical protein ACWHA3_01060 [Streptomyces cyaneofuscatus]